MSERNDVRAEGPAVHPVAAGGFAAAAPTYARSRPIYARAAIGRVKQCVPDGRPVLDVAAGTGILSGQLWRAKLAVVALEPVSEMLEHLLRTLPGVPAVRGVAEQLPFGPGGFGGVTVGEAFHWFDTAVALAEARRVLCDGGALALLRNRRDTTVDWVAQYDDAVMSEQPSGRPYSRTVDLVAAVAGTGAFGPVDAASFPNPRPCSPQQLVDRAASTSFVAAAEPDARARVLHRVAQLAAHHPDLAGRTTFDLPYVTEVLTWRAR
jgi:SAM-dependent methyltransferase